MTMLVGGLGILLVFAIMFGGLVAESGAPMCKSDTRPRKDSRK